MKLMLLASVACCAGLISEAWAAGPISVAPTTRLRPPDKVLAPAVGKRARVFFSAPHKWTMVPCVPSSVSIPNQPTLANACELNLFVKAPTTRTSTRCEVLPTDILWANRDELVNQGKPTSYVVWKLVNQSSAVAELRFVGTTGPGSGPDTFGIEILDPWDYTSVDSTNPVKVWTTFSTGDAYVIKQIATQTLKSSPYKIRMQFKPTQQDSDWINCDVWDPIIINRG